MALPTYEFLICDILIVRSGFLGGLFGVLGVYRPAACHLCLRYRGLHCPLYRENVSTPQRFGGPGSGLQRGRAAPQGTSSCHFFFGSHRILQYRLMEYAMRLVCH